MVVNGQFDERGRIYDDRVLTVLDDVPAKVARTLTSHELDSKVLEKYSLEMSSMLDMAAVGLGEFIEARVPDMKRPKYTWLLNTLTPA